VSGGAAFTGRCGGYNEYMSNGLILFLFLIILAGYVGVVIVYCGIASHIYNEKHKKARKRVKKYNHNLIQLLKMYEKEKR